MPCGVLWHAGQAVLSTQPATQQAAAAGAVQCLATVNTAGTTIGSTLQLIAMQADKKMRSDSRNRLCIHTLCIHTTHKHQLRAAT